jgi:chromosome segregation ATPase
MKKLLVFMGLASMAAFMSCGNETEKLRNAKDSVENVNAQQKDILYDLTETLVEVSTSLDSIAAGEGLLKRTDEGKALTRQQVIENLNSFKQMLAENREKLSKMEQQLSQRNDQIGKLSALIKHLNNELDEREATIARLEEVIKDQKSTIRDLESVVESSKIAITEMEEENVRQREQLSQQDTEMYTVYFTFGTKRELKDRGLLSGGFLKKKKADMGNVDKSKFSKADRRMMTEIQLPSGDAQVMSGQPADSYDFYEKEGDENSCILKITNPKRFWNTSDVLIIMLK